MGYHVAVIPDGNRRWAEENAVERKEGHREGVERVVELLKAVNNYDVDELTFWSMSIDNYLKRDDEEISGLVQILKYFINSLREEDSVVREQDGEFNFAGSKELLEDEDLVESIEELESLTEDNEGLKVNLALAYDGKWDIVQSAKQIQESGQEVTDEALSEGLELPEVDILLAYGEDRCYLSDFMVWQLGYATINFVGKNFPELSEEDLGEAIEMHENRRYMEGR